MPREQDGSSNGRDAITRTIEEAQLLANQRTEDGWEAVVVPALETTPVPSDTDGPEWGFVHTVPDDLADKVANICEAGSFPQFDIYRRRIGENVFFVTELLDPASNTALLIAGQYTTTDATELYLDATNKGTIRTVLERTTGERLARVEHENVEKFFPDGMDESSGSQDCR